MNPLACVLTPIGYIFPDNQTGELFLFDGTNLQNIGSGVVTHLLKYLTVKEINSFLGNGITIGFEQCQHYKRVLLTVKNVTLSSGSLVFVPNFQNTPAFFATLTPNISVVYKDGRYQLYKGVNSSIYTCDNNASPTLGAYTFSSNEHVANGTAIGTVTATGGTGPYTYIITTVNKAGLGINPLTGVISVLDTTQFDYTKSVLNLAIEVIDANGNTGTGSAAITINHVPSAPVLPSYAVRIPENAANGSNVVLLAGTDRDGQSLTYSILSGNPSSAFAINASTGQITVNDHTQLDYFGTNPYIMFVRVTASDAQHTDATVNIGLDFVHQAPTINNDVFVTADTAVNGTLLGTFAPGTQRAGQSGTLLYALVTDSTPAGAFKVDWDITSPTFGQVTVLDNTKLDPLNNNYVITGKVYDGAYPADATNFTISITVWYDPALLAGERYTYTCI
jgi:hypothetical protein